MTKVLDDKKAPLATGVVQDSIGEIILGIDIQESRRYGLPERSNLDFMPKAESINELKRRIEQDLKEVNTVAD